MSTNSSFSRVIEWCQTNAPKAATAFNPGATDAQISAAESAIGFEWTAELRDLFRVANGEDERLSQLIPQYSLLSLDRVLSTWKMLRGIAEDLENDDDDDQEPWQIDLFDDDDDEDDDEPQSVPMGEYLASDRATSIFSEGGNVITFGVFGNLDPAHMDQETLDLQFAALQRSWATTEAVDHDEDPEGARPVIAEVDDDENEVPGEAGSFADNWFNLEFIPFASWDSWILAVDLRPGPNHGCVIKWEPVDCTEGMAWPSLEAFFAELLVALETGGEILYERPRVTAKGNLKWRMED